MTTTGSGTMQYNFTKPNVNNIQLRTNDECVWVMKDVEAGQNVIDPNIRNAVQSAFRSHIEYNLNI